MPVRTFFDADSFSDWAFAVAQRIRLDVEECPLIELDPDWVMDDVSLRHHCGQFFHVGGVRAAERREGGYSWKQPMMFQPSGYVAIIHHVQEGGSEGNLLVRMLAEPGNKGIEDETNTHVLVAPPIQFSPGNLENHKRALAGETNDAGEAFPLTPFANVALDDPPDWAGSPEWEDAVEDGGRFRLKVNRYGLITIVDPLAIEEEVQATKKADTFAWIPMHVFRQLRRRGLLNGHLRSVSSLLV